MRASLLSQVLRISETYLQEDHANQYLANAFLSDIAPDNAAYLLARDNLKNQLISSFEDNLAKLKAAHDKVEGTTWYYHSQRPANPSVIFYLGRKKDGNVWLRMKGEYHSKYGWLFVKRIVAWRDGQKAQLMTGKFKRRNTSYIWETMDVSPTTTQISTMLAMAQAEEAIFRFEGEKGSRDYTLSAKDKLAISKIHSVYEEYQILRELEIAPGH